LSWLQIYGTDDGLNARDKTLSFGGKYVCRCFVLNAIQNLPINFYAALVDYSSYLTNSRIPLGSSCDFNWPGTLFNFTATGTRAQSSDYAMVPRQYSAGGSIPTRVLVRRIVSIPHFDGSRLFCSSHAPPEGRLTRPGKGLDAHHSSIVTFLCSIDSQEGYRFPNYTTRR
jgi:hypothetical protein